jgi:ATP-dependent DNA helicase RecG
VVKLGRFRTDSDLLYHDVIEGDLFTQVEQTIAVLQAKYMKARITYEGTQRVERFPVPEPALREAITNAIVHKDYAAGAAIQISVYADRLLVWNPGSLPEAWSVERLLAKHPSRPANPDLANTFFRAGKIESWGRGIDLMRSACQAAGCPVPQLRWEGGLWVEFPFAQPMAGEVTGDVAGDVTGDVTPHGTPEVARLLGILRQAMTRQEIQQALGLKHDEHVRMAYLQPALAAGLIEMTIPDKPRSRLQRYRLTAAGAAHVKGSP